MSLFVKDMDIPLFNPEDALYTHYPACICVFPDGTANLKILIPQYDGTYRQDPNEYAIENIPAPHGRLIDADKLTKNMRNYYPSIHDVVLMERIMLALSFTQQRGGQRERWATKRSSHTFWNQRTAQALKQAVTNA